MKYFRHTLSILALIVMMDLISGCGGKQTPASGSGTATNPATTNPATTVSTATATSGVTPSTIDTPVGPVQPQTTPTITAPIATSTTSTTSINVAPPITTIPEVLPPTKITVPVLGGTILYDRVLFASQFYRGLDYQNSLTMPVRGATVQLLNEKDSVLATTQTDDQGNYQFTTERNKKVRVRLLAQLVGTARAIWDIEVRDNTSGNALYVLDGDLVDTGSADIQTRNLHATTGWNGTQYGTDRSSGPFAVLDSIYDAVQMVVNASPQVVLPPLSIYWSVKNIAISGDTKKGHIGTSYFTSSGPSIYILGAADNDSDEFDRGVIQHEFAHYIESALGRSESIGGSHNQQSRLDMRVAFGEAWGNAFSGMAAHDPYYRDSMGASQSLGFTINVEGHGQQNQGWFSEESIQAILYDIFDANSDANDDIELGFTPILSVLTSDDYLKFDGFASVYSFISELKAQQSDRTNAIDRLVESYSIYGKGWYGEGETNNGGSDTTLPVYHTLEMGRATNVCSSSIFQDSNGVDARRFLKIQIPTTRSYTIHVLKTAGPETTNPQLKILKNGSQVASIMTSTANREDGTRTLSTGIYILEVYEQTNADGKDGNSNLACFDVSIE